uniref:Smad anchor for receptor activation-like C-terminal domain-containing protein n=1 Tax=Ditylenchus dipsaci TaxID=166011 RepID=A0A915ELR9_9BILA
MAKLPGSYVSLSDSKTEIVIPEWTAEEVKSIVETNRNMLGWALDFNQQADSHLVCEQNLEMGSFQTHIFSNHNTKRKITGATFIIFDGALKNSSEQFELRVVEDGLVVRMQPDTMAELIKALLAAENFTLQSANMHLEVAFQPSQQPFLQHAQGALRSPIDGHNLMGKYQYGLVLNRQFRSQNFVPTATEWALRLATVINMEQGKFPSVLQPKFFEVCEQIVVIVSHTIQPFIAVLVAAGQRRICLRVRVDDECAIYDSEQWSQLEDQHYYWTNSLDEQMIPFLYSICSWVPNGLHIELHLNIISTRPLPMELALGKDIGF